MLARSLAVCTACACFSAAAAVSDIKAQTYDREAVGSILTGTSDLGRRTSAAGKKKDAKPGPPIDVNSLLGPPVPGPSPTPGGGGDPVPVDVLKAMVLAAIDELAGACKSAVKTHYTTLYRTQVEDAHVDAAAALLRKRVGSGEYQVKYTENSRDGAAGWGSDDNGKMALDVNRGAVEGAKLGKKAGTEMSHFRLVLEQHDLANSLLHEIGHMYFTVFGEQQGWRGADQDVVEVFPYCMMWNGTSAMANTCPSGNFSSGFGKRCEGKDDQCYCRSLPAKRYGRSGNENTARVVANACPTSSYAAVLAPLAPTRPASCGR